MAHVSECHDCSCLIDYLRNDLGGRLDFLDIALLYALINFVGTIAILKFFRYRAIGDVTRVASDSEAGQ